MDYVVAMLGMTGMTAMVVFAVMCLVTAIQKKKTWKRWAKWFGISTGVVIVMMLIPTGDKEVASNDIDTEKIAKVEDKKEKIETAKEEKPKVDKEAEAKKAEEAKLKAEQEKADQVKKEAEEKALAEKKAKEDAEKKKEQEQAKKLKELAEAKQAYVDYYTPLLSDFAQVMYDFSIHFTDAGENPSVMYTDDFYKDTGVLLGRTQPLIDKMKNYPGEIPAELQPSHDKLMASMDEYQKMVDTLPTAIVSLVDKQDMTGINSVMQYMGDGQKYMEEGSALLKELN